MLLNSINGVHIHKHKQNVFFKSWETNSVKCDCGSVTFWCQMHLMRELWCQCYVKLGLTWLGFSLDWAHMCTSSTEGTARIVFSVREPSDGTGRGPSVCGSYDIHIHLKTPFLHACDFDVLCRYLYQISCKTSSFWNHKGYEIAIIRSLIYGQPHCEKVFF